MSEIQWGPGSIPLTFSFCIDVIASKSFVVMRAFCSITSQICSPGSGEWWDHLMTVNSLSCFIKHFDMIWALWHGGTGGGTLKLKDMVCNNSQSSRLWCLNHAQLVPKDLKCAKKISSTAHYATISLNRLYKAGWSRAFMFMFHTKFWFCH